MPMVRLCHQRREGNALQDLPRLASNHWHQPERRDLRGARGGKGTAQILGGQEVISIPATMPNISAARLPATYEHARQALAECSRIDECQQWADKAEALASYAKQAKDDQLRKLADRIQARAIRRCGELLKQVPTARGENLPNVERDATVPTGIVRTAEAAGLSERQRKTALRVASVEQDEFDRQVDSDDPPTVTALAEQGKRSLIDLGGTSPVDFKMATAALASLRRFSEFTESHDPQRVAAGVRPQEVASVRKHVAAIDSWLDRFIVSIGG